MYLYMAEPWQVDPVEFWWLVHKSEVKVVVAVDAEMDALVPREPETLGTPLWIYDWQNESQERISYNPSPQSLAIPRIL